MKRIAALILVAAVSLTACRGGDTTTDAGGIKTDIGVTKEPCKDAIDKAKGCIYLGIISDLTEGPFKALAVPITDAQKAFWKRVNTAGGIGGYEVDVTTYIRDNKYNPQVHKEVYDQIKGNILALAQTLGSPTTAAILADMKASNIVAAPAAWTSAYAFEDVIIESGANYCIESMNAMDYAADKYKPKSVLSIHYAGDYGDDAAAGAKIAAEKLGMTFSHLKTDSGADKQAGAIAEIIAKKPDLVLVTTGPTELATIVGQAAARGFTGRFIGTSPTWNPALNASAAAPALAALYEQSAPWNNWATNTPGHEAMRKALPGVTPSDGYTSGWVWSYPLKAALAKAAANKDLTRAGLLAAVKSLESVDYEGMLPATAGNYKAGAAGQLKMTAFYKPDKTAPTGGVMVQDLKVGKTAEAYKLEGPCFAKL
ncbi:branched-chain amino acid ABC transporter substrate-binding protein [Rhizocola hellebori]|uniref:Branched-chain amino acid ABC transporter substrate-binding protein n=1 Tax=Rhizocola hellebori TaxID=1392758 RepID=A0A8J3VK01_9ACTN|nr:ABC transporter substrate-binding protein [Rhizocola hellebori]GIH08591.1 branched-chain amino acid ABC transporter substrate-binding protein [Rhizocola hellebori]